MALTRVSGQVIKSNTDLTVGVLTATTASFTTVSVAGTITYDDVTNVDSVGLITARSGVNITSGGLIVTGISTVSAGTTSAPSISPSSDSNTGIFFPAADTIAFAEGGAEAARFDSSGRLLVGTSSARANLFNASASAQLQIEGTDGNNSAILIARNSNDTAPPNFHLAKSRGTSVGSNTVVQNNDLIGRITFTGSDGTEFVDAAFIEASVDGTPGANDMPGRLVFSTTADGASSPTERMRLDSSGRLGIGTTSPSVLVHGAVSSGAANLRLESTANSGEAGLQLFGKNSGGTVRTATIKYDASDYFRIATASAVAIAFETSDAERARIDSSGRLLVGTSSTSVGCRQVLEASSGGLQAGIQILAANTSSPADNSALGAIYFADNTHASGLGICADIFCRRDGGTWSASSKPTRLVFSTTADGASSPTERMRISQNGVLNYTAGGATGAGNLIASFVGGGIGTGVQISEGGNTGAPNAANATLKAGQTNVTGRSFNAAGTVNANGADYAEYMTKAGDFNIAKGDVCGVTADGLLTLDYGDAVSFMVKSTNPSYVGNDSWGVGFEGDEETFEAERQKVDRVAFAGQVPVNVTGAIPGQYIVPVEAADGGIEGIAKNEADLTLAEYMRAVGKVIAIEDDGRARIIVKVA